MIVGDRDTMKTNDEDIEKGKKGSAFHQDDWDAPIKRSNRFRLCCQGCWKVLSFTVPVYLSLLLFIIGLLAFSGGWLIPYINFEPHFMVLSGWIIGQKFPMNDAYKCTMNTCFNFSKCGNNPSQFKFYLYPKDPDSKKYDYYYDDDYKAYDRADEVFNEQYNVLKDHPDRTDNPEDACLFFPGFDTSSWSAVANVPSYWRVSKRLRQLAYWNSYGKNHVVFDRHEHDWQPFATDYAIVIRASLHGRYYRPDFDVCYHLQPESKTGSCNVTVAERHRSPSDRTTLAFWRGRYTSQIRRTLVDLYGKDNEIIARQTGTEQQSTYCSGLKNAKFGLNPRGVGLTTYRTLELLQVGAIPVYYGDHYILPYSEILDWRRFSVIIPEYQASQTKDILKSYSSDELKLLHSNAVYVYDTYFADQIKEMYLLIELLKARIYKDRHILSRKDSILGSKFLYSLPVNMTG